MVKVTPGLVICVEVTILLVVVVVVVAAKALEAKNEVATSVAAEILKMFIGGLRFSIAPSGVEGARMQLHRGLTIDG
jgi:hypothetical protein